MTFLVLHEYRTTAHIKFDTVRVIYLTLYNYLSLGVNIILGREVEPCSKPTVYYLAYNVPSTSKGLYSEGELGTAKY